MLHCQWLQPPSGEVRTLASRRLHSESLPSGFHCTELQLSRQPFQTWSWDLPSWILSLLILPLSLSTCIPEISCHLYIMGQVNSPSMKQFRSEFCKHKISAEWQNLLLTLGSMSGTWQWLRTKCFPIGVTQLFVKSRSLPSALYGYLVLTSRSGYGSGLFS